MSRVQKRDESGR